jgi:deazaflavin-dependent oxidoreductase (nitroreductase family)
MNNEFPRKGSALYGMTRGDYESRKRTLNNWRRINKIVIMLYEAGLLPLLGVGRFILLIYTKGRRSGKNKVTPLEYRKRGGSVILFSARGARSDWYRNLKALPDSVKLRIGFKTIKPRLEFIDKPDAILDYVKWYIQEYPRSSHFLFGWNPKEDDIETTDLSSLTAVLTIVKLEEC